MKKVLLLQSDQMILESTSAFLAGHGFKVYISSAISEAVDVAARVMPDIIVSDLSANASEFELCKALNTKQATSSIPLIYVTSHLNYMLYGLQIGVSDFLPKAYSYEQLLNVINANMAYYGLHEPVINSKRQSRKKI